MSCESKQKLQLLCDHTVFRNTKSISVLACSAPCKGLLILRPIVSFSNKKCTTFIHSTFQLPVTRRITCLHLLRDAPHSRSIFFLWEAKRRRADNHTHKVKSVTCSYFTTGTLTGKKKLAEPVYNGSVLKGLCDKDKGKRDSHFL